MNEVSARSVFQLLSRLEHYTADFSLVPASSVGVGKEAGSWVITRQLSLYPRGKKYTKKILV